MGTGETPARVRAVLLPPRPVPRPAPEPVADRTLLRSKEDGFNEPGFQEEGFHAVDSQAVDSQAVDSQAVDSQAGGSKPHGDGRAIGVYDVRVVREREPLVATAMAAVSSAEAETPSALPAVAPRPGESLPRHLLECRVSVIPRLPVVALEKPSSSWPDLTPSPVPRVSLIPPTGRIDPMQLLESDSRNLPTVAPRLRIAAPTPAVTMPRLIRPVRERRLLGRLLRDLRSSKREIAFGLGIGLGLSFALGKLGQAYLERRGNEHAVQSWTASALPSPEPRVPAAAGAAAPSPTARAFDKKTLDPATLAATSQDPGASPGARSELPGSVGAAAAQPRDVRGPVAGGPVAGGAVAGGRVTVTAHLPRSTKSPRRRATPSTASTALPPLDANPWGEAPAGELESRGRSPLSPSESAGLGHELPL